MKFIIVTPDGFKPPFSESKSDILSLDEGAIWSVVGLQSPEAPTLSYSSLRWVMGYPVNSGPRGVSGNRTTHLRFFRPTRTDRLRYHPICRKCTNRTSPECPKHPMHTITLHSRILVVMLRLELKIQQYQCCVITISPHDHNLTLHVFLCDN